MTIHATALATAIPSAKLQPVAVVDWVAFTVKLKNASHGGYLKRKYEDIGVSHAKPLDASLGSAAHAFRIVLQHPDKHRVIQDLLTDLERTYGLSETPTLEALEVAVDFWPTSNDFGAAADLTKRLMMELAPPVLNNPRLVDDTPPTYLPAGANIDTNRTLYIGNDTDNLMWRVYWKRTDETFIGDDGKRIPKPLPESKWRARAEVRLQGDALGLLGLTTPMDLAGFSFQRLYSLGYFKFCHHATGSGVVASNPFALYAAQQLGVDQNAPACMLGKFGRKDSRGRSLKVSRNLLTDVELSEAARSALRGLSRRF
ncbi:MAG: hypothetical protein KKE51_08940 [Gammaproteobacteria bacterium]|nr:hypothetical protein [Gammaproteobacteria bacterium]MBU1602517.1 hypothetical protein [Gammaproteobacteria bacterium]MBU2433322.1 hypothetical protein [Gammaproteobacteria bacterium]MBU2451238.1 hypothetical protein [Gammaproteobacteria bacterium]